jgi:hypothetical protein
MRCWVCKKDSTHFWRVPVVKDSKEKFRTVCSDCYQKAKEQRKEGTQTRIFIK